MRLRSWLVLQAAVTVSVAGAVVAVGRHYRAEISRANAGTSSIRQDPGGAVERLEPGSVDIAFDAAGTFLGIKDELLIERMRTGQVVRAKLNKGGSSISFRLDFADGSRAAFKPLQINPQTVPRKEVAAYRIQRLLGFHSVAPATMRTLHRDDLVGKLAPEAAFMSARINAETTFDPEGFTRGELSFWIPDIVDSHLDALDVVLQWWRWMTVGEEIPAEKRGLMAQLSSLLVFDLLQNNSDRFSGGNIPMSPDGRRLFWMDNTFGFGVDPEGHLKCRTYLFRVQKFSRKMISALRRLDLPSLRETLAVEPDVLSPAEMEAVLSRRDVALKYIDGLVHQFGEDRVMVFE